MYRAPAAGSNGRFRAGGFRAIERLAMTSSPHGRATRVGLLYATAAYLTWGLFPVYFRLLQGVPAPEILCHRIVWSAAFTGLLVTALRRWPSVVDQLRAPGTLPRLAASAVFISANWLIYIWAVNAGRVLEASLGYFVNPLLSVLLGVVFLRESLSRVQAAAVALAGAGVAALVVRAGHVPWVALALALTFGLYGLVRKQVKVDAIAGLLGEVVLLSPLALLYLAFTPGGQLAPTPTGLLLAACGVVTALPLIWFAVGVRRLRLSTIGLLQYLNPTMQFLIAVFAFGERFTPAHALAFGCIWASLALYSADTLLAVRRAAAAAQARRVAET
jgi:chloramphenicol-sensitive protein RarD